MPLPYHTLEKVKNIIALSGYINENILAETYKENNFDHLNFYSSHGDMDQVIPIDWARKAPVILEKLNIKHVFEEFPAGAWRSSAELLFFKKMDFN